MALPGHLELEPSLEHTRELIHSSIGVLLLERVSKFLTSTPVWSACYCASYDWDSSSKCHRFAQTVLRRCLMHLLRRCLMHPVQRPQRCSPLCGWMRLVRWFGFWRGRRWCTKGLKSSVPYLDTLCFNGPNGQGAILPDLPG